MGEDNNVIAGEKKTFIVPTSETNRKKKVNATCFIQKLKVLFSIRIPTNVFQKKNFLFSLLFFTGKDNIRSNGYRIVKKKVFFCRQIVTSIFRKLFLLTFIGDIFPRFIRLLGC